MKRHHHLLVLAATAALLASSCGDDSADATTTTTNDGSTVITAAGDIDAAVEEFRDLLGDRRQELTWDGVPDELARPHAFPGDFFADRGILLESPGGELGVSADGDNPDGAEVRFADLNPSYAEDFRTFSEERLFSPTRSNVAEATFVVPGTDTPAAVRGFGAVYTGVDVADSADFEFYDADGNSLGTYDVPVSEDGLSFLAVAFDEPIIARVRIVYGNEALGPDDGDGVDVAVMDDFIFGEPHALDDEAAAAVFAQLEAATDDASAGAPRTYVGAVEGTGALVAVAVGDDGSVAAYVCDGEGIATWYSGDADGDSIELVADDDTTLTAAGLDTDELAGTVELGDASYDFTATEAAPGGDVLLRTTDGETVTGWILHGGTLRGASRSREITAEASADDIGTIEDVDDLGGGGEDAAAIRLFPKLRCRSKARTVVQTPIESPDWNGAVEDFLSFGCSVESFLPGANIDSTDNLCLLFGIPPENCGTVR